MDEASSSPETAGTRKETPHPSGESMKAEPFDSTPAFQHFRDVMRGVLSLSKKRLDELVHEAKEKSARNGDPHAPGQKRKATSKKSKPSQDHPHR